MAAVLTAGHRHESAFFTDVMDHVRVPRPTGRPKKRPEAIAGDRAYDSKENRKWCWKRNIESVIPARNGMHTGPGRPPTCDKQKYERRIATRYEKKASHYKAMLQWAFIGEYLKR